MQAKAGAEVVTLDPVSDDTSTLRRLSVCKSYTEIVPLSARSATARNFLLGDTAKAVMPSLSGVPGVNRWTLVSTLYSTTVWPTGYMMVFSSTKCMLSLTSPLRPKMCLTTARSLSRGCAPACSDVLVSQCQHRRLDNSNIRQRVHER